MLLMFVCTLPDQDVPVWCPPKTAITVTETHLYQTPQPENTTHFIQTDLKKKHTHTHTHTHFLSVPVSAQHLLSIKASFSAFSLCV